MEATAIQSATAVNATIVALANIQPNSFNPRRDFNDVSLGELADSIRQQGVIQPIALRPIADTDRSRTDTRHRGRSTADGRNDSLIRVLEMAIAPAREGRGGFASRPHQNHLPWKRARI